PAERGRAALAANRGEIARLLWRLWSPNWSFGEETFKATADSFGNADFVDVTIQSYRHRYGNAAGDPGYEGGEAALAGWPSIRVPAIALYGEADGVVPPAVSAPLEGLFSSLARRAVI